MLDIDSSDELTTLLKISKTPTVLLINNGDVVDGIKGLANDRELDSFFKSLYKIVSLKERKAVQSKLVEQIYDLYEQKLFQESNQLIAELQEGHVVDDRTWLMVSILKSNNLKELK